nr:probable protein phosphatase 2C 15 [Tanacetum cinerariifolium]
MGSRVERHQHQENDLVPLAALISREIKNEKMEKPTVRYGHAAQSRKGEDYFMMKTDCQRVSGHQSSSFSVFAVFDGHNGNAAALYSRDNLLNYILSAIPCGLGRDEWLQALPRALVAGFVKTDKEFQSKGQTSGTTATFVIVDRWTVTVASVGDSRCILDAQGGAVSELTVDHRLEENQEERERVKASGGEVGRLRILGGAEIGPLRCWPGGLCLSRSIGDMDVGEFIVPIPYVKQVKLSDAGGRLIIASDGIWDAVSSDMAAKSCRGLPAELAARQVVKEALRTRGLKDDTTCIVVDIIPPDTAMPPPSPPRKKPSKFSLKSLFFRKKSHGSASKLSKKLSAVGIVEELFEEGSAMLSERLGNDETCGPSTSGLFMCAVCQVDLGASEGISVHAGSIFSTSSKPWEDSPATLLRSLLLDVPLPTYPSLSEKQKLLASCPWDGLQPGYCGYPGFKLDCNNNGSLIVQISGSNYSVGDINYEDRFLELRNSPVTTCSLAIKNLTFDNNNNAIFQLASDGNVVFFNNCDISQLPKNLTRYRIGSCDQLVMNGNDSSLGIGMKVCSQMVVAPVEWPFYKVVDGGNYREVMKRGFKLLWNAPVCSTCNQTGGRCGYLGYQVYCFCPNSDETLPMVGCRIEGKERNKKIIILITALIIGVVMISVVIFLCFKKKLRQIRRTKNSVNVANFLKNHEFLAPKKYSYSQVKKMTNSFKVKLGQGGFGSVYKGELSNGNLVAVKILSELKGNGEDFINEVASVGRTCHVNIVNLVGFCGDGHRRALIYEFMPNGSLERFIYGRETSSDSHLGWEKLHQIAIGIARGLEYLHSGCNTRILHFDIKPHNILLDQDLCPKISDFGLAKLFLEKKSMISVSHMRGTPGYIAPELFSRNFGQVSHKSDVYSYGMMILEIVGGRKNIEVEVDHTSEIYFPHWIYKKVEFHEEQLGLHGIVSEVENEMVRKMIIVGLWCIQTNPLSRPTITKVLEMLEGDLISLEIPPKPYLSSPPRHVGSPSTE